MMRYFSRLELRKIVFILFWIRNASEASLTHLSNDCATNYSKQFLVKLNIQFGWILGKFYLRRISKSGNCLLEAMDEKRSNLV